MERFTVSPTTGRGHPTATLGHLRVAPFSWFWKLPASVIHALRLSLPPAHSGMGIGVVSNIQWLRREIERSYRLMRGVTDPVTKERLAEHVRGLEAALRDAETGGRTTRPTRPPKRTPPDRKS